MAKSKSEDRECCSPAVDKRPARSTLFRTGLRAGVDGQAGRKGGGSGGSS
jgi:hypothetical protein